METKKGVVAYNGRRDYVCTYCVTDDGRQYYFLDEDFPKKLSNGNRIASTALVEAIDPMVKASHVGLLDVNGNEIIPFENKAIKLINDDIILVERAVPLSSNVIEAIKLKSDPLAATKLVSTPAKIKDKLNARMGSEGRYVFNDQFSEATVCDINGNNLINGEYFSFIGISGGKLFFSKNVIDSDVTEYSILPPEVQSDVTPETDSQEIDVNDVVVSKDTVENALVGDSSPAEEVDIPVADTSVQDPPGDTALNETVVEDDSVQEAVDTVETEIPSVSEDGIGQDDIAKLGDSFENGDVSEDDSVNVDEDNSIDVSLNESNDSIDSDENDVSSELDDENVSDVKLDINLDDDQDADFDIAEKQDSSVIDNMVGEIDNDDVDVFKNSKLKIDSIDVSQDEFMDSFDENNYDDIESTVQKDNIIVDVAKSMTSLIAQNKNQRDTLNRYRDQISKLNLSRKNIVAKAKSQEQRIEELTNKLKSYEKIVSKLESQNQSLESKVADQDRIIATQNQELDTLRPQLQGKEDLIGLLADAQAILGEDNSSYDGFDS